MSVEEIANGSRREEAIGRRFMGSLTPYVLSVLLTLTAVSLVGCKKNEPVKPTPLPGIEVFADSDNKDVNSWSEAKRNCLLGLYYVEKGEIDSGIPLLNEAVKLDPDYSRAYYGLGHAYMAKGDPNSAMENFSLAIEHDPRNFDALKFRGDILLKTGDWDGALADYDRARLITADSGVYFGRGVALSKKGRYSEAEEAYNVALELDPNDVNIYVNRGILFEELGKLNEASMDFRYVHS